jgi:DNA-binding response OmpR family regulator
LSNLEPEVLSTLEGILRHHGAEVLTAASADEALKLLDQQIPAAVLSACLASEHASEAESAGLQIFIEKPVQAAGAGRSDCSTGRHDRAGT